MPMYRVYVAQVNQTYVEVHAKSLDEAKAKGYRKWRREEAHSSVTYVENLEDRDERESCR